jgi:multiple sugar transport system permease protein
MTKGGPGHATTLIGYYIWKQAFDYCTWAMGGLANLVFFAIFILTIIQWILRKRWVYSEE